MKIVLTLQTPLEDLGNPQVSPDLTLRTAALERLMHIVQGHEHKDVPSSIACTSPQQETNPDPSHSKMSKFIVVHS